ncbi:MAG: DUF2085 domain-containing protein [Clostridia bacterium]|nr:DUF2085 domain-containing protein [Clostridia bacterium]
MSKIYNTLFHLGTVGGCHQLPERSFFIKGYQFPVCARCTGVFIGYVLGIILHLVHGTSITCCLSGCAVMFLDWYIQYREIKMSTNIRRLITGVMGGCGVMGIQLLILEYLIEKFISFSEIIITHVGV